MVPVCSSVMLELVLAVHSYHVIAYPVCCKNELEPNEDVDFKTFSDRYTNSRMVLFLTHIDGVRANLFSINSRQKMTRTMVNQQFFFFFFHRKIGCNKLRSF